MNNNYCEHGYHDENANMDINKELERRCFDLSLEIVKNYDEIRLYENLIKEIINICENKYLYNNDSSIRKIIIKKCNNFLNQE